MVMLGIFCYTGGMSEPHEAHIIAFVGLAGSGKSTAVKYLADQGVPKVTVPADAVAEQIIGEVSGLLGAGQHRIVLDDIASWDMYVQLKHAFPGALTVVSLLAPRKQRHHRLNIQTDQPLPEPEATARDLHELAELNKGGVIAMADDFVTNDGSSEELLVQLDALIPAGSR